MFDNLFVAVVIALSGFVTAGIVGSFYQLVSGEAPKFMMTMDNAVKAVGSVLLILMAGPFILMRNGLRLYWIERRPVGWLMASAVLSFMWSVLSGLFVLTIAFAI
ncbi:MULTISPECIES: DUF6949 family protein [Pseudovibrio]|uniref:DUF6949 family protein n=1 Tax=Stappiaceae TaxID=2821832 RepID=UPI0023672E38|nr:MULTISPECIES: hypothetical protein [Pseudovibrio]MDD7910531.1 hypothetical protein [Pseudovibrio exalbescens]MDX5594620.1 hypothetical protein [Pseudovibrio sp. SPO723]